MFLRVIHGHFLVSVLISLGCASSTRQVDLYLSQTSHLSKTFEIPNVPFIDQKEGHCGPATLTMALQAVGQPACLAEITSQVFTPGMNGTFQSDLIGSARRQGMLAIPIENIENLFAEISAGHPVIVFENLALSWLPQWHYALVYGYDLMEEVVVMHSGPEKAKHWDLRKFERSWKLAGYWGLVVLPPHRLSATATELQHLSAAAALETLKLNGKAEIAYRTILSKWPTSLGALIGLGNSSFSQSDYKESERSLILAVQNHPQSAVAWHNLAIAQKMLHKKSQAQRSAITALRLATELQKTQFEISLKQIL